MRHNLPAVYVVKGVPIITTGCLKSLENGNPGMPIFTGCVYFHDTGAHLCTSLASRPMIVVFGLGMRLRVRMRTKLENGVLSNGQHPQSIVNGFC